jgi:hypothetical protein
MVRARNGKEARMYQTKLIRTIGNGQSSGEPPLPPLYHWLGADAERVAIEALGETNITPFYHWLGAEAEKLAH